MTSRNPSDHPIFWCDELKRFERKRIADESLRDWKNRKLIERRSRAKEQSHAQFTGKANRCFRKACKGDE
uniref:Uncharacterized protein n=1 Tax=Anopheles stephensi TaxID=30069 RepID=A0A182Y7L9_ANOST